MDVSFSQDTGPVEGGGAGAYFNKSHDLRCPIVELLFHHSSNLQEESEQFQLSLTMPLSGPAVLIGDFSGITRLEYTNTISPRSLLWPWVRDMEGLRKIIDD